MITLANMKYELAKQLKEAGFPQHLALKEFPKLKKAMKLMDEMSGEVEPYIPTLSELIEACGEEFGMVARADNQTFIARNWFDKIQVEGKTPEEAVAKLYIKLNK